MEPLAPSRSLDRQAVLRERRARSGAQCSDQRGRWLQVPAFQGATGLALRPASLAAHRTGLCSRTRGSRNRWICRLDPRPVLAPVSAALACSSAVLGPLLDNYHSQFGVLAYTHVWHPVPWLSTSWFVPLLFAYAGVSIGLGALVLDAIFPPPRETPSIPSTFLTIAAFSSIYYVSGYAASIHFVATSGLLWLLTIAEWASLDRSVGGAVMGLIAAGAGWIVESFLVSKHIYEYASPDAMGLPYWIIPCYVAGGPAVASLARTLVLALSSNKKL